MHSCIYEGNVSHRRLREVDHAFSYSLFMAYLDLDELPGLLRRCRWLSPARFAPASFVRSDHYGDPRRSLSGAIRDLVARSTGQPVPAGPVRLLTQLRFWGHYFSPLNLYFCFDRSGDDVTHVVAEVSNTPWGDRHMYVLGDHNRCAPAGTLHYRHRKEFHVSPFMDMDSTYHWRLKQPEDNLAIQLECTQGADRLFNATMALQRREMTDANLRSLLSRYPFATVKVLIAIYYQAYQLWKKKCKFYPHPKKQLQLPAARQRTSLNWSGR